MSWVVLKVVKVVKAAVVVAVVLAVAVAVVLAVAPAPVDALLHPMPSFKPAPPPPPPQCIVSPWAVQEREIAALELELTLIREVEQSTLLTTATSSVAPAGPGRRSDHKVDELFAALASEDPQGLRDANGQITDRGGRLVLRTAFSGGVDIEPPPDPSPRHQAYSGALAAGLPGALWSPPASGFSMNQHDPPPARCADAVRRSALYAEMRAPQPPPADGPPQWGYHIAADVGDSGGFAREKTAAKAAVGEYQHVYHDGEPEEAALHRLQMDRRAELLSAARLAMAQKQWHSRRTHSSSCGMFPPNADRESTIDRIPGPVWQARRVSSADRLPPSPPRSSLQILEQRSDHGSSYQQSATEREIAALEAELAKIRQAAAAAADDAEEEEAMARQAAGQAEAAAASREIIRAADEAVHVAAEREALRGLRAELAGLRMRGLRLRAEAEVIPNPHNAAHLQSPPVPHKLLGVEPTSLCDLTDSYVKHFGRWSNRPGCRPGSTGGCGGRRLAEGSRYRVVGRPRAAPPGRRRPCPRAAGCGPSSGAALRAVGRGRGQQSRAARRTRIAAAPRAKADSGVGGWVGQTVGAPRGNPVAGQYRSSGRQPLFRAVVPICPP